jgi:hypothetical protein
VRRNTAGIFQCNDLVGTVRAIAVAQHSEQRYDRAGRNAGADASGLMLGAKYKLSDQLILGLLVGCDSVDVARHPNQASVDARQTYRYGTLQFERGPASLDAALGYGQADYRRITANRRALPALILGTPTATAWVA